MVWRIKQEKVCPSKSPCFMKAMSYKNEIDSDLQCQGYVVYVHIMIFCVRILF